MAVAIIVPVPGEGSGGRCQCAHNSSSISCRDWNFVTETPGTGAPLRPVPEGTGLHVGLLLGGRFAVAVFVL